MPNYALGCGRAKRALQRQKAEIYRRRVFEPAIARKYAQ
jgi:hypothetical protein